MPLIILCMPAATLGFGRTRNPEGLPLFILALMIDLSCPSCLPCITNISNYRQHSNHLTKKMNREIDINQIESRERLLETIVPFESSFGPLGAPNSTLEWEAQLKEHGTTNLSIRFLIFPYPQILCVYSYSNF